MVFFFGVICHKVNYGRQYSGKTKQTSLHLSNPSFKVNIKTLKPPFLQNTYRYYKS